MLISIFISPTFATEINDPATCDSGTLSTDTGPTNLRANYESNTLNLRWYDDNGNLLNVSSSSNSCTYGGSINLPAAPTKRGYTFKGWKVALDLSDLDTSISATQWGYKSGDGLNTNNHSVYGLTKNGTWGVTFSYGKIIGMSICSVTSFSVWGGVGTPDEHNMDRYCWCRVTGIQPSGDTAIYLPTVAPWIYAGDRNNLDYCKNTCARQCADVVYTYGAVREAIYGQSGS